MTPGVLVGRIAVGLGLALAWCPTARADDDHAARVKRLVDKIARGDEVESAAASEQLIELITAPLAEAVGPLDQRPTAEVVRLRAVMERLTGALRMRVRRLNLPPEDRALFDAFARAYPELTERLFDGNYMVRQMAVNQIPLEPDTGAGVLIAAKVDDEDADVAGAALQAAAKLHDAVVARNLRRYIRDATSAVRSGFYGPDDQAQGLAKVVALIVFESIKVVAAAGSAEGVPELIDGTRFFGRTAYWDESQRGDALRSLGKLGDPRASDTLLDFLDDESRLRWRSDEKGQPVLETVGDVALMGLVRVHGLKAEDFGLLVIDPERDFAGYRDSESRREGHRALRIWHAEHARTPSSAESSPTSHPTSEGKD